VQQELILDTAPQVRLDEREKDEALITYFIRRCLKDGLKEYIM